MANVNVIYHHFPHYRAPVMRALTQHGQHTYKFWGDVGDYSGIKAFKGDDVVEIHPVKFNFDAQTGRMDISNFWPAISDPDADALIIIGNPNMRATWLMALAGRMMGKKVMFWAHGWLKPEHPAKRLVRNTYFGLANRVLVYGERARELATRSGFRSEKVATIYNSLDWHKSREARAAVQAIPITELRRSLGLPVEGKILICTARLTAICQFDLLLEAVAKLKAQGEDFHVALVGEGPEREKLERQAKTLGIGVTFFGAIYDEITLAEIYRASDLTVSPGKIGLTAIHSLTYGVPAITHGDLDEQMPEVEAIEHGVTGAFFIRNDSDSLAATISQWFACLPSKAEVEAACERVISDKFNPNAQTRLIDAAVTEVVNGR